MVVVTVRERHVNVWTRRVLGGLVFAGRAEFFEGKPGDFDRRGKERFIFPSVFAVLSHARCTVIVIFMRFRKHELSYCIRELLRNPAVQDQESGPVKIWGNRQEINAKISPKITGAKPSFGIRRGAEFPAAYKQACCVFCNSCDFKKKQLKTYCNIFVGGLGTIFKNLFPKSPPYFCQYITIHILSFHVIYCGFTDKRVDVAMRNIILLNHIKKLVNGAKFPVRVTWTFCAVVWIGLLRDDDDEMGILPSRIISDDSRGFAECFLRLHLGVLTYWRH